MKLFRTDCLYKTLRWLLFVCCVNKTDNYYIFLKSLLQGSCSIFKQWDAALLFTKHVLIRIKRFYSYLISISKPLQLFRHGGNNYALVIALKMWKR